jgi:hypothetical protein
MLLLEILHIQMLLLLLQDVTRRQDSARDSLCKSIVVSGQLVAVGGADDDVSLKPGVGELAAIFLFYWGFLPFFLCIFL